MGVVSFGGIWSCLSGEAVSGGGACGPEFWGCMTLGVVLLRGMHWVVPLGREQIGGPVSGCFGGGGACLRGCRTESRGAPGPWGCAVPHSAPQLCVVCPPTPLPVGAQGCPGSRKLPTGSDGPGRGETESNGSHLLPRPRPAPEVSRPPCRPAEEGSGVRPSSRTGSGHLIRSCQRGIFFWVKVGSPASPALASPPGEAGRLPKR